MSNYESDIIHKLSADAAEPRQEFSETLRNQLLARERTLRSSSKETQYIRSKIMSLKKVSFAFASVLVVAVATLVIINNAGKDPAKDTSQATNQNTDNTSLESSLSTEPAGDVTDPLQSISFTPLQPTILLADEIPGDMYAGSSSGPVDTSDTLYMEFNKGSTVLYKITQTTKQGNYPEDAEPIPLTIKGKPVQGNYYRVSDESDPRGKAPRSYIFMTVDGINVEISEFGNVTKNELVKLANSLI